MKKKTQTKWNSAALGLGSCWKKELHQERATAADQFVERQGRTTAVKIQKKMRAIVAMIISIIRGWGPQNWDFGFSCCAICLLCLRLRVIPRLHPFEELWASSAFNIIGPLRAPFACDNSAVLPWADATWQPSCSLQDVDQWTQHLEPSSKVKVLAFCLVLFSALSTYKLADVDRNVRKKRKRSSKRRLRILRQKHRRRSLKEKRFKPYEKRVFMCRKCLKRRLKLANIAYRRRAMANRVASVSWTQMGCHNVQVVLRVLTKPCYLQLPKVGLSDRETFQPPVVPPGGLPFHAGAGGSAATARKRQETKFWLGCNNSWPVLMKPFLPLPVKSRLAPGGRSKATVKKEASHLREGKLKVKGGPCLRTKATREREREIDR